MAAALARRERTLGDLLGRDAGRFSRLVVTDLTLDSRAVRPGAAFVALRGGRDHGLKYAQQAFGAGAAIVLYDPSETSGEPPERSLGEFRALAADKILRVTAEVPKDLTQLKVHELQERLNELIAA